MAAVIFLTFGFFLLLELTHALPTVNSSISTEFYSCIPQSPPDQAQVPVARYEDCIRAILYWGNIPGRDKPTAFSRDPKKGYKVPHTVVLGQCEFEIDTVLPFGVATGSFAEVSREAGSLAKDCVLKAPHAGGVAYVGQKKNIEIVLHGRLSPGPQDSVDE